MRLATILEGAGQQAGVVHEDRCLPVDVPGAPRTVRELAGAGERVMVTLGAWASAQPASSWRSLAGVRLGPAVPDPGAIYTVGLNYDGPGAAPRPPVPLIFGKAPSAVAAHGATLAWDRAVTDDVDAEVELGVVIGAGGTVFGYTVINDVSARDERLDGDQWLLGKSMPGFCPVGPWIVTADALDPTDIALRCTINGEPIQDGRTARLRHGIPAVLAHLSRHLALRPGDLVATGTPVRVTTPPGPARRLRPGDTVTATIEGIGDLTTHIA